MTPGKGDDLCITCKASRVHHQEAPRSHSLKVVRLSQGRAPLSGPGSLPPGWAASPGWLQLHVRYSWGVRGSGLSSETQSRLCSCFGSFVNSAEELALG